VQVSLVPQPGAPQIAAPQPGAHRAGQQEPLWQLVVALLPDRDPETEWFSIQEIAPLLGITPRALMKHARDL
jgi:hypothetical protein